MTLGEKIAALQLRRDALLDKAIPFSSLTNIENYELRLIIVRLDNLLCIEEIVNEKDTNVIYE